MNKLLLSLLILCMSVVFSPIANAHCSDNDSLKICMQSDSNQATIASTKDFQISFLEPFTNKDTVYHQGCCSHHSGVCGCSGGRASCCDGTLSPSCGCD